MYPALLTYWYITDVITIEKTGEFFRLVYDVKGRFTIHRISAEEAKVSFVLGIISWGIGWLYRRPIDVVKVRKLVQNEAQSNFWYDGLWSVHS